jgi:hypothetical protein
MYSRCSLFAMILRISRSPVNPADCYASFTTINGYRGLCSKVYTSSQRHDYVRLELGFHEFYGETCSFEGRIMPAKMRNDEAVYPKIGNFERFLCRDICDAIMQASKQCYTSNSILVQFCKFSCERRYVTSPAV